MMFTIGNWIIVAIVLIGGVIISASLFAEDMKIGAVVNFTIVLLVCVIGMVIVGWYHTSTASGIRDMKDYQSELSNGIERDIIITAEDGREIFHYEGKVDVESNHEDNYIKFEGEDGKRYIIYYGITDTIQIIEK